MMKNLLGSIIRKNEHKDFKELISFMTNQHQNIYLRKIRHCFFSANQAKIANCVSASSLSQHIEPLIKWNQYPT